jgi:putative nucleotidyltransferase with HDIG domain
MQIHVLADSPTKVQRIRSMLEPRHTVSSAVLGATPPAGVTAASIVVDADLRNVANIEQIRAAMPKVRGASHKVFIIDKSARATLVQAYSLGASSVIPSPLDARSLQHKLAMLYPEEQEPVKGAQPAAMVKSAKALEKMFAAVLSCKQIDVVEAQQATGEIIDTVAANGLTTWLDNVRRYHEGTYQHCLLVTGVAVDFALSLGFNSADVKRIGIAATLHDIGKAAIPLEILDKPGALSDGEMAIMQGHAKLGYDALRGVPGITAEVLDAVRHHHEFLDGSGYPDRLKGNEIGDLVRVLTVADIFAALIEARAYRPPMHRGRAYEILGEMSGLKLEKALVTAFKDVALTR